MGIAEALLGKDNPFTQWVNGNQNFLGAIGSGLGQGQNIQSGLGAGLQMLPQAKALDRAAAEKLKADKLAEQQANATTNWLQQNHPDLAQMVTAGMPVSEAWQTAMQRMQPQGGNDYDTRFAAGQQYGLDGDALNTFALTGSIPGDRQNARAGVGQPIFGRNKTTGAIEPWQSMTDGTMINTANPQANPGDYDFNPGITSGARTTGTVDAKTAGAARAALPGATVQRDVTLDAIDRVTQDEDGLNEWFGQWGALPRGMTIQGGSKMGNWVANFSQAEGQSFLQARQFLKGQGAITELESAKAEQAYSRMAAAKQSGDKQTFLQAAADFKSAVEEGYRKLESQAQGAYSAGAQPPAALTNGNQTSTGVQWSVEP